MTENAELLPAEPDLDALDAAGRINYHYRAALDNYQAAHEHALRCGWELACQKNRVGWGGWRKWIKENLEFSNDTADRLVAFYEEKIGTARKRIGLAVENKITPDELEAATAGLSGKSVTAAMIEAGVRTRSTNWGGAREGSGRPPLLPTDPATGTVAPNGLHRAAAAAWGEIDRLSSRFLAKKFDLALTLAETTAALGNVRALVEALEKHKKELEPKAGKGKR